ncbi:unnamed protein product [Cladocopium goreaui]|uniref:Alpha-galactosidase (Melibiase) n=1 Tax=Cladocopium goreaui TaxID=2562237 RepID=A0A9P1G3W6_9DINO|nr:unnamed protein product [Cladocopium goreaui]
MARRKQSLQRVHEEGKRVFDELSEKLYTLEVQKNDVDEEVGRLQTLVADLENQLASVRRQRDELQRSSASASTGRPESGGLELGVAVGRSSKAFTASVTSDTRSRASLDSPGQKPGSDAAAFFTGPELNCLGFCSRSTSELRSSPKANLMQGKVHPNASTEDVVFQEKGFRAKSAEHLVLEVLSSPEAKLWKKLSHLDRSQGPHPQQPPEARAQVAHLYQGPVHHLQGHCVKIPEGITEEEWEEVYSKVRFNSFHLNGCCFLPVMALFNHSCAPNAAITQLPPHSECHTAMVVVAELGISKGTEIVYSYNSDCLTVPLQVRRQRLLSNWGFLCKCSRCEAEDSRPEADSEVQQNLFFCDTDELEDLLSQENGKLHDLQLYHSRQEAADDQIPSNLMNLKSPSLLGERSLLIGHFPLQD